MSIGIQEIFLISIIALIILGPERLPAAVKTCMVWVNRIKRGFNDIKVELEREIDTEEVRREIHNENILHELHKTGEEIKDVINSGESIVSEANQVINSNNEHNK